MENGLSEFAFRKPANLHGYWSKWTRIYIDLKFWWRRGEPNSNLFRLRFPPPEGAGRQADAAPFSGIGGEHVVGAFFLVDHPAGPGRIFFLPAVQGPGGAAGDALPAAGAVVGRGGAGVFKPGGGDHRGQPDPGSGPVRQEEVVPPETPQPADDGGMLVGKIGLQPLVVAGIGLGTDAYAGMALALQQPGDPVGRLEQYMVGGVEFEHVLVPGGRKVVQCSVVQPVGEGDHALGAGQQILGPVAFRRAAVRFRRRPAGCLQAQADGQVVQFAVDIH